MIRDKDILVVEDDSQIASLVRDALGYRGFNVRAAYSGKEALELLSEWQPHLIISDIMMPEMDGYTLFYRLKLDRRLRHIPVIFLSARGSVEDQLKGLERGAVEYISKPFKIVDLISKVIYVFKQIERENRKYQEKNLSGTLEQIDIVSLLQMMEQNKKTGLLTVRSEDDKKEAILYFQDGNVMDAVLGKVGGKEAFYELLRWEQGEFEFEQTEINIKPRLPESTQHLILEGLRVLDEEQNEDEQEEALA